ncbi:MULTISPECIES: DUF1799 domain-containing protein [unclassified Halomonas]|uniref:DUF1799 domain-containing protein n=1 Tax=unclassified Halomonas TaxID=2609666 RepID=UPI002076A9E7|nr:MULTISPECIES: DUF1799 domain-containing protein [unclassified Halomonas]
MVRRAGRAQPGRGKKLRGAGQWWAQGPAPKDQRKQDADRWGLKDADAPPEAPTHFEVWEEHWPALELFLAMRTQWRVVASMTGEHRQGIDYTALYGHPKFARLSFDEQDERLTQIQHIEAGALAVINSQTHIAEQEEEERWQRHKQIMEHHLANQERLLDEMRARMGLDSRGRFVP